MSTSRLKVAWICHFSNPEIRSRLPLKVGKVESALRSALRISKMVIANDFAPWITYMAREMEGMTDADVHVISPHSGLTDLRHSLAMNGVSYHFFKPDKDYVLVRVLRKLFCFMPPHYRLNRQSIARFIKEIKPDVIMLIGAENSYYSVSALDIEQMPFILMAQTVYSNPNRAKLGGLIDKHRWELELKIHQKVRYFSSNARMHRDLILKNNPAAIVFRHRFPQQRPLKVDKPIKKYDFVFFAAGVTNKKGIEDALQALSKVKAKMATVTMDIVGKCAADYKAYLLGIINKLGLDENIVFHDYFPKQSDMHAHIQQAKFAVLPVKLDSIPGTISESMMLDLPVISYKTTGTPRLNKYGEAVLLCDIGDIDSLATNMMRVMREPDLAESMIMNSRKYLDFEIDNKRNVNNMVRMFHAVHEHYYRGTEIPVDLLFDPNEFPKY